MNNGGNRAGDKKRDPKSNGKKKKIKKAAGEKRQKGPREGQTEATAISY